MRYFLLTFVFNVSLLFAYPSNLEIPQVEKLKQHISFLASDELEGRGTGTLGFWKAADYVAHLFQEYGLKSLGENETFFQKFLVELPLHPQRENHVFRLLSANVIGLLPANDKDFLDKYVVVGAHLDHLGYGGQSSLDPQSKEIHNGADDNASGVAGVLETARVWSQTKIKHGNIIFIVFGAEEMGLLGSLYFVEHPTYDLSKTYAMLNLDMIGRLSEDVLTLFGTGTALEWDEVLDLINSKEKLSMSKQSSGQSPSDNTSFYVHNIPVLFFNTGSHEDYHRPSDDVEFIHYEGMLKVLSFLSETLLYTTQRYEKLTFQETKDPHGPGGGGGLPYFGTMPDYSFQGKGVKLLGVNVDSPAQRAGLQKGDIIIKLGQFEVTDVYNYTEALRAHKDGDTVSIIYLRENVQYTTQATLGRKSE
ncbi:MAG: M20/M25/M40 family metallo-hydrolase [Deltaproteobacteria bacterium]|nr:M20/M25/M40 family metallo-hydrolase [Deltaproteobacteria bacterium]